MLICCASGISFQSKRRGIIASQLGNSAAMPAKVRAAGEALALSLGGER